MPKKRILIFSTAYIPFVGGAEVAIKEICDRINDVDFVMVTAKLNKSLLAQEKIGNIEVHRLGSGDKWDKFRLILQGGHYAENLGHFDAVWSIMASYAGFAALRYKKGHPDVPYLLTLQEGDSKWDIYKHVWWCWPYFKQIFKKADKIQAISNYLAKWATDMGAKCSVEVVPNGVDLVKFQRSSLVILNEVKNPLVVEKNPQSSAIPAQAGMQKQIITVSRLVKKNGVADLIKAMNFLDKDIHLLIIGDGILKKELMTLKNKLGLVNRVHFLGNIGHDNLVQYLSASAVFCRPSLSEGLGNVFLEAMAAGVPIVGTKVGGIPDFLKDGEIGLYCEVYDPEDIARKIERIMNDDTLRDKLIENGRRLVLEKYSWDLIANKMQNIFEKLYLSV